MRIANMLGPAILTAAALLGCGDDSDHSNADEFSFNTDTLACPEDSLDITDRAGHFPDGSQVTFTMGSTVLDGSAVVLPSGMIDCGFPAGSPPGEYMVAVMEPGASSPYPVGTVTLTSSTCPP